MLHASGQLVGACGFNSLQRQLGTAGFTRYDSCAVAVLMALTAYKGSCALLGIPEMTAVPLLCCKLLTPAKDLEARVIA
jgi:hypothetical protein